MAVDEHVRTPAQPFRARHEARSRAAYEQLAKPSGSSSTPSANPSLGPSPAASRGLWQAPSVGPTRGHHHFHPQTPPPPAAPFTDTSPRPSADPCQRAATHPCVAHYRPPRTPPGPLTDTPSHAVVSPTPGHLAMTLHSPHMNTPRHGLATHREAVRESPSRTPHHRPLETVAGHHGHVASTLRRRSERPPQAPT